MRFSTRFSTTSAILLAAALTAAVSLPAATQEGEKLPQVRDANSIPPRATPADYQAHAQAGSITIGAEFAGHSIPTPESVLTSEDYVVVEVGIFGASGARSLLSFGDFSMRINGSKKTIPAQPAGMVFGSLKDPNWAPPQPAGSKSKTTFGSGGGGGQDDKPAPPKVPIGVERALEQRLQKASLPEGDRPLPEAGLLFFPHHGKTDNLRSIELIYSGPGGKATLALNP